MIAFRTGTCRGVRCDPVNSPGIASFQAHLVSSPLVQLHSCVARRGVRSSLPSYIRRTLHAVICDHTHMQVYIHMHTHTHTYCACTCMLAARLLVQCTWLCYDLRALVIDIIPLISSTLFVKSASLRKRVATGVNRCRPYIY